jgi:hypothetical protein
MSSLLAATASVGEVAVISFEENHFNIIFASIVRAAIE